MNIILIVGYVAVFFQSIRVIPQVVKGFKTKSVKDISLGWIIIAAVASILWITYGILIKSVPVMLGNVINLVCYIILLVQKKNYKKS